MIVAGIDPSLTNTGIAVLVNGGETLALWSTGLDGHNADSYLIRNRRVRAVCRSVTDWITTFAAEPQPDLVVIEGPSFESSHGAAHDRAGLWHGLVAAFDARKVPVAVCAPTTLKKWATGKGNAQKADVLAAARSWWPERTISDADRGDALVLACIGALYAGDPLPFPIKDRHRNSLNAVAWPETVKA